MAPMTTGETRRFLAGNYDSGQAADTNALRKMRAPFAREPRRPSTATGRSSCNEMRSSKRQAVPRLWTSPVCETLTFVAGLLFQLQAEVRTVNQRDVLAAMLSLLPSLSIEQTETGLKLSGRIKGKSASDLNRSLLSALRRVEQRTTLRAEWTSGRIVERFFDYVPEGTRTSARDQRGLLRGTDRAVEEARLVRALQPRDVRRRTRQVQRRDGGAGSASPTIG